VLLLVYCCRPNDAAVATLKSAIDALYAVVTTPDWLGKFDTLSDHLFYGVGEGNPFTSEWDGLLSHEVSGNGFGCGAHACCIVHGMVDNIWPNSQLSKASMAQSNSRTAKLKALDSGSTCVSLMYAACLAGQCT
jgi:hypothetical protein